MPATLGRLAAVLGVFVTAVAVSLASAATAEAAPTQPQATDAGTLTSAVTGSFTDASGGVGTFTGTFTPQSFAANDTQVLATGVLSGSLVDSAGTTLGDVSQTITTPVVSATSSGDATTALAFCQILDLVLAPLDLNLLGLVVHLDRVHLNITAVSGPGNLLGNLLCAVTGLLDGGNLTGLAAILNQILAILGLLTV